MAAITAITDNERTRFTGRRVAMTRCRKLAMLSVTVLVALLVVGGVLRAQGGTGQKARKKTTRKKTTRKTVSTKSVDVKVKKFRESFVRQAAGLARSYEESGNLVKTRQMLELILKFDPEVRGVRDKIKQIDEQMLSANELEAEVDVSKGWGQPVAAVFKGQPLRIQAAGDFRFVASLSIGPAGFPVADTARDMAGGIRCGALIGVVVPPPKAGKRPKPGKPFLVGGGGTITTKENGLLFLKINAPAGHKCNGRVQVRMTGNVRKP